MDSVQEIIVKYDRTFSNRQATRGQSPLSAICFWLTLARSVSRL